MQGVHGQYDHAVVSGKGDNCELPIACRVADEVGDFAD